MRLNILSGKIAWFGKHSGYEPLTDYFPAGNEVKIITIGSSFWKRLLGKVFQVFFKWQKMNPQDTFAELNFLKNCNSKTVSHVLYVEGHLGLIEKTSKVKKENLVVTIHLPMSTWSADKLSSLKQIEHSIILYKEEIELFAKFIPLNKIKFIRLGISIDFFKPDNKRTTIKNKILIIGHYLRNFDMLFKVYEKISGNMQELEFHIIIPAIFRNIPELISMAKNKHVFFHQNLSDQQLLEQYQDSNVLLIPMNDSGANTAIVQALAVGLPIITTDVGGIRSYGGGDVFPVIENNNVHEMVVLFNKYFEDPTFRNVISKKQRDYALQYLDWNIIAQQHLDFYKSIQQ